jgi:hypothetical protein
MDIRQQHIEAYEAAVSSIPETLTCQDECYEESSHVFKCMECDLQFQMDTAFMNGDGDIDEIVRMRVDPVDASSSGYQALELPDELTNGVPHRIRNIGQPGNTGSLQS